MAAGLNRRGDHWALPCEGLIVGQVRIDYAYGLEFTETPQRAAEVARRLRVNTAFTFTDTIGAEHHLDPEGPAERLAPALVTRHQQLVEGNVWANGRIRMTFANHASIEVAPHDRYEAWTMTPDPIHGFPFTRLPHRARRSRLEQLITDPRTDRTHRRHFAPLAYGSLRKTPPQPQPSSGLIFNRREWSTFQPALTPCSPEDTLSSRKPSTTARFRAGGKAVGRRRFAVSPTNAQRTRGCPALRLACHGYGDLGMGNSETRIAVKTDEERRVVTLVGWRRRLYRVALPVGIAGGVLQGLDLAGDHLGVWARVGDVAVFLAVVIPFALLGGPDDIIGRARPAQDHEERTSQKFGEPQRQRE